MKALRASKRFSNVTSVCAGSLQSTELAELEEAVTETGDVRTLPSMWADRGGLDGFFIARLVAA